MGPLPGYVNPIAQFADFRSQSASTDAPWNGLLRGSMRLSPDLNTVRSEFAGDPDMSEIVALFVRELPQRIAAMHSALAAGNLEQLRLLAHQLKGAAGGYGFPKLGEAAALVDQGIKDGCDANVIRSRVGMLAAFAARIRP